MVLDDVKHFFISAKVSDPYSVIGVDDRDLEQFKGQEGVQWPCHPRSEVAVSQILKHTQSCFNNAQQAGQDDRWQEYEASKTDKKNQDSNTGYLPTSETDLSILGMIGASPTATQIAGLIWQKKLDSADVAKLAEKSGEMHLSSLPASFRISNDMYIPMALHSAEARKKGKQAFTYVDLTRDEVLSLWLTPVAGGGCPKHQRSLSWPPPPTLPVSWLFQRHRQGLSEDSLHTTQGAVDGGFRSWPSPRAPCNRPDDIGGSTHSLQSNMPAL